MGLYNRDAMVHEVANQLAGEYDADDYSVDEGLQSFVDAVSRETLRRALPTQDQLTSCSKVVINLVKMLGADANPDNPDAVQAVADAVTLTLFPYFKPLEQDQPTGFELPDV